MFDKAIVGPHKRHMQTFEGFLEGFDTKIPYSIEEDFAENHLMEVQILKHTKISDLELNGHWIE